MSQHDVEHLHHCIRHSIALTLVVFLLVMNIFIYDYASAAEGDHVDANVLNNVRKVELTYNTSKDYMYEYSVTWGELIGGWENFVVDTYYLTQS